VQWRLFASEVKHYINRLSDNPGTKMIISITGTFLSLVFGNMTAAMQGFIFLLLLDYLTGVLKALKREELSSWLSRKSWGKFSTYAIVIALAHSMQQIGVTNSRDIAILWAGSTEAISVLENFDELGIPLPAFLRDRLLQTRKKKFGSGVEK
jgi:toxin secretion/phage lysis holin